MADFAIDDVELRRAAERDAPGITRLVAAAYGHYRARIGRTPIPMRTDQAAAIRDHEVWVLAGRDRLVGVLELVTHHDHLVIENVAVTPVLQGRGLGARLLDHVETRARELGIAEIRLYTNERFVENLAIYARRGYRETHRTPTGQTALVHMTKRLEDGPAV
ncbi:MAG: GNAT family N-acetyltransferase [Candidatus Limnocylindria bacterium]